MPDPKELYIAAGALLITLVIAYLVKRQTYSFRRPNGKPGGGLLSMHTVIAFAVLTVITLAFQNLYLTIAVAVLAYMIASERYKSRNHYLYQIIIGVLFGVFVPYFIYSVFDKDGLDKFTGMFRRGGGDHHRSHGDGSHGDGHRERYADMPASARDERHEADSRPEMKLDSTPIHGADDLDLV